MRHLPQYPILAWPTWASLWSRNLLLALAIMTFGFHPKLRSEDFKRELLAIVDDDQEEEIIHDTLENVCNYMGFKIVYLNSSANLPQDLSSYRAILTWAMDSDFYQAQELHELLAKAQNQGVKLLFFGQLPASVERKSGNNAFESFNSFLKNIGFKNGRYNLKNPLLMQEKKLIPELIDFEHQFTFKGTTLANIESVSDNNLVALSVSERRPQEIRADLVCTAPWGGFALNPAVFQGKANSALKRWVLNPFLFLQKALDLGSYPIPDVTTWNGCRAIYCHIDGDAFNGICRFDKKRLCSEVIFEEVLEKFKYPHTLSLVNMWFDPDVKLIIQDTIVDAKVESTARIPILPKDREHWIKIAHRIFAPGWIEAGLHGYAHPLRWVDHELALRSPNKSFSLDDEFGLSQKIFTKLMNGRSAQVFQWTGDCVPDEAALAKCAENKLLNINGGDSMFDETYNSYIHVAPLYRQLGPYIQVYASGSNENIYTNEWQGPFYGFRNVIETFKRTESPRRISPINVYYHFYSGEMAASVKALQEVFEWAEQQELTPIRTTDYIRSVNAFINTRIEQIDDGWNILNCNGLRTLRFDHENRTPNIKPENRLLGYHRDGESLYIHLKPGLTSKIQWTEDLHQPRLEKATCVINNWELKNQTLSIDLWGYRPSVIEFKDLAYKIQANDQVQIEEIENVTRIILTPEGNVHLELTCLPE